MEELPTLNLPTFRYRLTYKVTWAIFFLSIGPLIWLLAIFKSEGASIAILICWMSLQAALVGASVFALLWGIYSRTYRTFQERIIDWVQPTYGISLSLREARWLSVPSTLDSGNVFPRAFVNEYLMGKWPLYTKADGWYVSNTVKLSGQESTAPALQGLALNVVLVSNHGASLLVQALTATPLPRGLALGIPPRRVVEDAQFKPHKKRVIVGFFLLGLGIYFTLAVVLGALLIWLGVELKYDPGSPIRLLFFLPLLPALPAFNAGSKRLVGNRKHEQQFLG